MNRSIENLQKNRTKISLVLAVFIIVISGSIFPIIPANIPGLQPFPFFLVGVMILLRVQLVYVCYLLGKFIHKLYPDSKVQLLIGLFILNAIGLALRVWIEWGEFSLMNNLSTTTVLMHLLFMPSITLYFYHKVSERINKRS